MKSDPFNSEFPVLMSILRVFGLIYVNVAIGLLVIRDGPSCFLIYTILAVFFTGVAFKMIMLSRKCIRMIQVATFLSCTMVITNSAMFFMFWILIFPIVDVPFIDGIVYHSIPMVLTLIECSLNQEKVKKVHLETAMTVFLVYILVFNIPYTIMVKPVYPGLNYRHHHMVLGGVCNARDVYWCGMWDHVPEEDDS